MRLPNWASEIIAQYQSGSAGCFVLHGNVNDRLLIPSKEGASIGRLQDFLLNVLLPRFHVVLSYDVGRGIRVERGEDIFSQWPSMGDQARLPSHPLEAVRYLSHYQTYIRNIRAVSGKAPRVAVVLRQADLICPALPNALNYDLNALASLLKGWATDVPLQDHGQAAFLISPQINALHPLVAQNPRVSEVSVPLPHTDDLEDSLEVLSVECPNALRSFDGDLKSPARRLTGVTLSSLEALIKRRHFEDDPLQEEDLSGLKKALVERDCEGLIEFVEPSKSLDDVIGLDAAKQWMQQDLALWKKDAIDAMPMGYLLCGPVGTGKTYIAECLAGEANVPVVTIQNFRDRWVGSTEANLERIFELIHALGRCIVFIDEADQALGSRQAASNDSGVSSRVYSMMAQEMSDTRNRGKILWVLASSRPDLIEVDLKRPGRIDVKIPLFPIVDPDQGFFLIRALAKKHKLSLPKEILVDFRGKIPDFLTPGAAEAIAVKAYRLHVAKGMSPEESLGACLDDYRAPISLDILRLQMRLAAEEATEHSFVPKKIREILELD